MENPTYMSTKSEIDVRLLELSRAVIAKQDAASAPKRVEELVEKIRKVLGMQGGEEKSRPQVGKFYVLKSKSTYLRYFEAGDTVEVLDRDHSDRPFRVRKAYCELIGWAKTEELGQEVPDPRQKSAEPASKLDPGAEAVGQWGAFFDDDESAATRFGIAYGICKEYDACGGYFRKGGSYWPHFLPLPGAREQIEAAIGRKLEN